MNHAVDSNSELYFEKQIKKCMIIEVKNIERDMHFISKFDA